MSALELDLQVIVYGSAESDWKAIGERSSRSPLYRCADVKFRPRIPSPSMLGNEEQMKIWTQAILHVIATDLKYSQKWCCEFCGKPARETVYNVASGLGEVPPQFVAHAHQICDAGDSPCCRRFREAAIGFVTQNGGPPPKETPVPHRSAPELYPLSASCAKCNKVDEEKGMNRCSRCKLTMYCGSECQRADWARHKEVCKIIKEVDWTWD